MQAINDSGVVAGGWHIMTPLPGQPQVSLSTTSLSFPPTPVGQTSAPQTIGVTNTGNTRLDIAGILASSSEFRFSGCLDPTTNTASLEPGASCTLSVRATPSTTGTRSGTLTFWDSAPGSPGLIAMSVTGTAPPPSCALTSITKGPPAQANFTMQDTNSGLKSIVLVDSSNATVNIPNFVQGASVPINVTATQSDTSQASKVDFQVTNMAGGTTACGTSFGGSSTWTDVGGTVTGKITVFRNGSDLPEAFVRGPDNSLWHTAQTSEGGGWTAWENLGGNLASDPVMADPDTGCCFVTAEVFAVFKDGAVWHIKSTGTGHGRAGQASAGPCSEIRQSVQTKTGGWRYSQLAAIMPSGISRKRPLAAHGATGIVWEARLSAIRPWLLMRRQPRLHPVLRSSSSAAIKRCGTISKPRRVEAGPGGRAWVAV